MQEYAGCGLSGLAGDDILTFLMAPGYCTAVITMSQMTPAEYDPVLLALDGAGPEHCFAYADNGGPGEAETLVLAGLAPGYYYIVVDSVAGCGTWDLSVEYACGTPTPTPGGTSPPAGTATPAATATPQPTVAPTEAPTATAVPCEHNGDANGDGQVTPGDAQRAFTFYLACAEENPTREQYCAADFCGTGGIEPCDNSVTPGDARGIMRLYLGFAEPCAKRVGGGNSNSGGGSIAFELRAADGGDQIEAMAVMSGATPAISAFGFDVRFDSRAFTFKHALPGELDPGWLLFGAEESAAGVVTVGAMSLESIPAKSTGSLMRLVFEPKRDAGPLTLTLAGLVDDLAEARVEAQAVRER